MITLIPFKYRTIVADPPWKFKAYSEEGREKSAEAHYETMTLDEIKRLPVSHLAHPDGALLIMWATAPMVPQALEVVEAWGFEYCTMGAWAKQSSTGRKWAFGNGYRLRSAMEPYIVATLGKPATLSRSERNLIVSPVREHSRKPERMIEQAEAIGDGPRCEFFARQKRPGWDCWGNETGKFPALVAA